MNRNSISDEMSDRELQNRFTAYVRKAMENTRNSYYNKLRKHREREELWDEIDDEMIVDTSDITDALFFYDINMVENISLVRALSQLDTTDLAIIKLRILYGSTYRNIGRVLKISEDAVRMRYNRAIQLLREMTEE